MDLNPLSYWVNLGGKAGTLSCSKGDWSSHSLHSIGAGACTHTSLVHVTFVEFDSVPHQETVCPGGLPSNSH